MSLEQILWLDRSSEDRQLARAQQAISEVACQLCDEGVDPSTIAVAALQLVMFALVKSEGQLATADLLNHLADNLRSEPSDHVADMEVRGEA